MKSSQREISSLLRWQPASGRNRTLSSKGFRKCSKGKRRLVGSRFALETNIPDNPFFGELEFSYHLPVMAI